MYPALTDKIESEYPNSVTKAMDGVFRPLLANIILNFDEPKFRKIKIENPVIKQYTEGLSNNFKEYLFDVLKFSESSNEPGVLIFSGDRNTLKEADVIFSAIEKYFERKKLKPLQLHPEEREANPHLNPAKAALTAAQSSSNVCSSSDKSDEVSNNPFIDKDFEAVSDLKETARHTLLHVPRVRNCFFDAKTFSLRQMLHGRVYVCTEKCKNDCLEAHWHLFSGKGLVYAYVAHLSSDAKELLHLGIEYGYQYNSLPGSSNFRKTINFTEKLISFDGKLLINNHPNKPVESCIYCGVPFSKIFL
ncbi:unnamed protein product [Phytomonas sp. Hart1]|nr:unnamed protein product [Phytomonas sp. Hart1]|eukprot:CCW66698.1 unnamed protein product [Phytomonas sp. isolate Hart1]